MKIDFRMIAVVGLVIVVFITFYCSSYFYCKSHSESIAAVQVQEYCKEHGYDLSKLSGPEFSHTLGIPVWAGNSSDIRPAVYTWEYFDKNSNTYLLLIVYFDDAYGSHFIAWDMNHEKL